MVDEEKNIEPASSEPAQGPPQSLGRKTARALYWNLIGGVGTIGGRWFESIALVWLLNSAGYGIYRSAFTLVAFILPFTSMGLEAAVGRFLPEFESSGVNSRPLLRKVLVFRIAVCAIVAAGMVFWARPLAKGQLHDVTLWPLVVIAAIILLVYGVRNIQYRVLVARFRQRYLNAVMVGEIFGMLLLAFLFIHLGLNVKGAMLALLLAGSIAMALSWWKNHTTGPEPPGASKQAVTMRRMIAFSGSFYTYNMINMILQKPFGILMIGRLHPDIREVAYFDVAWTLAFFAVSISGKGLSEGMTLTLVSEAKATGDFARLRKIFQMLAEYIYILSFAAVAGLFALGEEVLELFYGGKMEQALWPMLLYLPFVLFQKLGGLTANFLAALDKEKILAAGRLVTGIINLLLALWLIPVYGAMGAILSMGVAANLSILFEIALVHFYLRPSYPWRYFGKMILIGLAVWSGASVVNNFLPFDSLILRLMPAVIVGVAIYIAGLVLLKPISAENLKLAATLKLPGRKWMLKLLMPR